MSILVKPTETITVTFYYRMGKNRSVKCITEKEFDAIKPDDKNGNKSDWTGLNTVCRLLGFRAANDLQRESMKNGVDNFDWIGLREKKLAKIAVSWDAKDDNGKDIPLSESNLSNLHPAIAGSILQVYDTMLEEDKEEVKPEEADDATDELVPDTAA